MFKAKSNILSGIIVLTTVLCLSSCGMISINDSGYKRLSAADKARVVRAEGAIDSLGDDGKIYQVDVAQMKDYIGRHDKVVVYEYASFCSSAYCVSPKAVEDMCKKHGYSFCLILSTYEYLERIPQMGVPLLAIWQQPYGTDNCRKYCLRFFDELTGVPEKTRGYGRFYRFDKGRFTGEYMTVDKVF